jgi:hypothetical protein
LGLRLSGRLDALTPETLLESMDARFVQDDAAIGRGDARLAFGRHLAWLICEQPSDEDDSDDQQGWPRDRASSRQKHQVEGRAENTWILLG